MKPKGKKRREELRDDAELRQEAWGKLTPEQQIAELDRRLGKGKGAKRQRERLAKLIGGVLAALLLLLGACGGAAGDTAVSPVDKDDYSIVCIDGYEYVLYHHGLYRSGLAPHYEHPKYVSSCEESS